MRLLIYIRQSLLFFTVLISACGYPPLKDEFKEITSDYTYIIGAGDNVNIFVWGNPDISTSVSVRPDGKITIPLVEDIPAYGKTPFQLARIMEEKLEEFIRDPQVVVIVTGFIGIDAQQIRVIGQLGGGSGGGGAAFSSGGGGDRRGGAGRSNQTSRYSGLSIPYTKGMTLLDLIIEIGSIGEYADGNRASIIRKVNGVEKQYGIKMDDLVEGDLTENVQIFPGDIVLIPEAFF